MSHLLDASTDSLIGIRLTSLTEAEGTDLRATLDCTCARHQRIRLLLWFDDLSPTAAADAWDALALTPSHLACIERFAVVGAAWAGRLLEFAGRTGPYEGRHFAPRERDAAWRWLAGKPTPTPTWAQPDGAAMPKRLASVPGLPREAAS